MRRRRAQPCSPGHLRSRERPRPASLGANLVHRQQLSRTQNRSKLNRQSRNRNRTHNRRRVPLSTQKTMSTIGHDQNAKRFTTEVDGQHAELTYTLAGSVMTITHTRVPEAISGRGIAAELMSAALRVAETAGWSVNPACSYAAAYMRKAAQGPDKKHIEDLLDEALDESFPASDSPSVGGSS